MLCCCPRAAEEVYPLPLEVSVVARWSSCGMGMDGLYVACVVHGTALVIHAEHEIASCFNAIDPVMAATIVGNGRFARRVPVHLRNLLLAESASNDVTTSVCLGLSILLTRFPGTASELARSLFVYTILYQIFLAAGIGLTIGWAAGKALEYQEKNNSTDRESFLVFYLMVALVCIGLGSLLGIDDVLMAFCAGYNFDKTKWWRRKNGRVSCI